MQSLAATRVPYIFPSHFPFVSPYFLGSPDGLEVGNAVRLDTLISSAVSSGFFAATYLLEAEGKTIISFRGTDLGPSVGDLADDVLNGWFGGAGFAVAQLDHAEDYFALVGARNP
ncbi:MAG: hypothetical protein U5J99_13150 [Parvularculaceae bacterium]|nr:hypothetical protein [Parvularculaceae bacterium]